MSLPHVSLAGFAAACPPELLPRPGSMLAELLILEAEIQVGANEGGYFSPLLAQLERLIKVDRADPARRLWKIEGIR